MTTIVVGVDFSPVTDGVVRAARELASRLNGHVWLLHVAAPDPEFVGYEAGPDTVRDAQARHYREEHRRLNELGQEFANSGLAVTSLLVQGATAEKILEHAQRLKAGYILLGASSRGVVGELFMGSVCRSVVQGATCPVAVVPAGFAVATDPVLSG